MGAVVDANRCTGCGTCAKACPVDAVSINQIAVIDPYACTSCGACINLCPEEALSLEERWVTVPSSTVISTSYSPPAPAFKETQPTPLYRPETQPEFRQSRITNFLQRLFDLFTRRGGIVQNRPFEGNNSAMGGRRRSGAEDPQRGSGMGGGQRGGGMKGRQRGGGMGGGRRGGGGRGRGRNR